MKKIARLWLAMTLLSVMPAVTQDSNYWNLQYGTRSTLLGGAVIGSVQDLGAVYYNPGALSLSPNPEFLLTARVYQLTSLKLENGVGDGQNLASSKIEPAPSLLAGSFNLPGLDNHRFGYSILTRQRMKFDTEARGIVQGAEIGSGINAKSLAGEFVADQNIKDMWAGLTWSYKLNERLGIGITQFHALRDQKTRRTTVVQSLSTENEIDAAIILDQLKFKHGRILWKAGIDFDLNPLTLGATITTPSISILGNGSSFNDIISSGIDTDGDGQIDAIYAVNIQEDIKTTFRSPLSIGIGLSYRIQRTHIHASAEWFNALKRYTVMELDDLTDEISGATLPLNVIHETKSIINIGGGVEYYLNDNFRGYASFITDFSAAAPNSPANLTISTWDIFHINTGAAFKINKTELIVGLNYAFGHDNIHQRIDLTALENEDQLIDPERQAKFIFNRLKLVFGFSLQI